MKNRKYLMCLFFDCHRSSDRIYFVDFANYVQLLIYLRTHSNAELLSLKSIFYCDIYFNGDRYCYV